jgi:serine/threonine protein kinase
MRTPDNIPGTLPTDPQLQQLANRLEQAWRETPSGFPPPDLGKYLPSSDDPLRPLILRELVRLDLEMHWRRGVPIRLEFYAVQFPELGELAALPAELIFHEYRVRRQYGDRPNLSLYQARFPIQYQRLLLLARGEGTRPSSVPSGEASPSASGTLRPSRIPPLVAEIPSVFHEVDTSGPRGNLPSVDSTKKDGAVLPPAGDGTPAGAGADVVPMSGGYRLLKRLGSGALGEVWKAEAPGGIAVAVKRLSRSLDTQEAQAELRSLEHVKQLRHPHLVQIHAFWVHKRRFYVVMELADGSLLDRAVHYGKQGLPGIPLEELLRYMREAADALDFLHAEGIHHRDIKPANILLLKGSVKVADFGLARPLQDEKSMVNVTFCGTPAFMAPEVWDSKFSTHSDQWSLAVTYLELRLNRPVFKNCALHSLMFEIRAGRFDLSLLERAERRVLRRALRQNPRQRYPSCKAFVEALEAVFRPPPPPPPLRRRWLLTAVMVLACLVAGVLFASILRTIRGPAANTTVEVLLEKPPEELRVHTGSEIPVSIGVVRQHFDGPIRLVADVPLRHVIVRAAEGREGDNSLTVSVRVDHGADPGKCRIHLRTAEGIPRAETFLDLTILYLPANFEPVAAETERDSNSVEYYKRIRRRLGEREEVQFVLVPLGGMSEERRAGAVDPKTFYISRDKITRGQFGIFQESKRIVPESRWKSHAHDDVQMPVRDVTVEEAHAFAEWLGGRLPTLVQSDKAAGRYHPSRGEGPYKGSWKGERTLRVAVDRRQPLPVGESADDESLYGCRDMAGNGLEWTRNVRTPGGERLVPFPGARGPLQAAVYLRGKRFTQKRPLTFEDLEEDLKVDPNLGAWPYDLPDPAISFRVVLEPSS